MTTAPLRQGTSVGGRYTLVRRLGSGGMAAVWLADDAELHRQVAVKVVSEHLAEEPGYLERFRREAKLAAGFTHPSLVKVFDFSDSAGRPYLVMEHVAGGTLADRLAAGEPVEATRLATELLGALDHIHGTGVLHRDVKPANVLIGADGRARLTDFGIAQPQDATRLTQTGQVLGTLRYIAPEVLEGAAATAQSDLYSCGVVLRDVAGPDAGGLAPLIDALTAPDPAARPDSAAAALELVPGAATETTALLSPPPRAIEIPAATLAIALVALLLVAAAVLALAGGDDTPSGAGAGTGADRAASHDRQPTTTVTNEVTTAAPAPPLSTSEPKPKAEEEKPAKEPKQPSEGHGKGDENGVAHGSDKGGD